MTKESENNEIIVEFPDKSKHRIIILPENVPNNTGRDSLIIKDPNNRKGLLKKPGKRPSFAHFGEIVAKKIADQVRYRGL